MDGKTHFVVGLATGLGISYFTGLEITESVVVTSVATMASLAPDLDTAGSLTNRITRPVNRIAFIVLLIVFVSSYVPTEVSSEMIIGIIGYYYGYRSIVLFSKYVGIASLHPSEHTRIP